jgi:hypothetical protein
VLEENLKANNDPEDDIVEEILVYLIDFRFIKTSGVDLVEHIHHEESVEDDSVHGHLACGYVVLSAWCGYQVIGLVKEHEGTKVE